MGGHAGIPASHPLVLGGREFIKRLIHHEKAHAVAQIEKVRVRRIVAGANGVDADFLEQTQTSLPRLVGHGRAERTRIMMNANAFELGRNAVEKKSLVRVE